MALCRYCGEKTGWFSDVHKECIELSRRGCDAVALIVASALREGKVFSDAKRSIDQAVARHRIPRDELHSALMAGWAKGADEVGMQEPLHPNKHSGMVSFYEAAGLTNEELLKTDGYKTVGCSLILWFVMHGDPSPIACPFPHPFNLVPGELPLAVFGSTVYSEETAVGGYQGGYAGASIRLGHGVYYHVGGFKGERTSTTAMKEIDYGSMLLTTRHLYFGGDHKTFRIPYEHIVSFRFYVDGLGIFRDSANAKAEVFTITNAWPTCGWFLYNLTRFLAQPEARTLYRK